MRERSSEGTKIIEHQSVMRSFEDAAGDDCLLNASRRGKMRRRLQIEEETFICHSYNEL